MGLGRPRDPTAVGAEGGHDAQPSAFRSWDFDAAIVVLFDEQFGVRRAARLPVDVVEASSRPDPHVNGHRVIATDELLDRGEDWTQRLRNAADEPFGS